MSPVVRKGSSPKKQTIHTNKFDGSHSPKRNRRNKQKVLTAKDIINKNISHYDKAHKKGSLASSNESNYLAAGMVVGV